MDARYDIVVVGAGMAGVMMFSRALALEAKRDGVRVLVIASSSSALTQQNTVSYHTKKSIC